MEILTIVVIFLVVGGINSYFVLKGDKRRKRDIVCLPKFYLYFGIFFLLFSVLPLLGIWWSEKPLFQDPVAYLFLAVDLLMILLCINQINWRIIPFETEMIHFNFLGRKKVIPYTKVKSIREISTGDTLIKIDGKIFPIVIDKYASGLDVLMNFYNRYVICNRKKSQ